MATSTEITPILFTPRHLAATWAISTTTVDRMIRRRAWEVDDLPMPVRVGPDRGRWRGRLLFPVADVVALMDRRSDWHGGLVTAPGRSSIAALDTRDLARALDVPYDTIKKWCAARLWEAGGLPMPITLGPGSHLTMHTGGRGGQGAGLRRWRSDEIDAWVRTRRLIPTPAARP